MHIHQLSTSNHCASHKPQASIHKSVAGRNAPSIRPKHLPRFNVNQRPCTPSVPLRVEDLDGDVSRSLGDTVLTGAWTGAVLSRGERLRVTQEIQAVNSTDLVTLDNFNPARHVEREQPLYIVTDVMICYRFLHALRTADVDSHSHKQTPSYPTRRSRHRSPRHIFRMSPGRNIYQHLRRPSSRRS